MRGVGIYDQIKAAIQDMVAPALQEIHGEPQAVRADIRRVDEKIDNIDVRLTTRIDSPRPRWDS